MNLIVEFVGVDRNIIQFLKAISVMHVFSRRRANRTDVSAALNNDGGAQGLATAADRVSIRS